VLPYVQKTMYQRLGPEFLPFLFRPPALVEHTVLRADDKPIDGSINDNHNEGFVMGIPFSIGDLLGDMIRPVTRAM
jgi:hypothetical protein